MNAFLANLYLRAIAVRDREEGQAMAEYGIILALIAVVGIGAVTLSAGHPRRLHHDRQRDLSTSRTSMVAVSHSRETATKPRKTVNVEPNSKNQFRKRIHPR